ncbi:MAG: helix-turn-helix domain-containing protein [Lactobacillus crispatus]|uniref:Transcriptional regulator n=3 Tax=Lactobacillus crispatus TaxID=47770 RepID=D5H2J9_LACCS|nr:helix-turn-helix transcriptional regulator [Lactobacillus crispatus]MBI1697392.1 transcriptional regulator [Lactobacillus crispatus]MBI1703532.1 transcriptional regulator [Lactobacillus crispatus]MCT3541210.1 XRE family transcriptional regulator [Lactobacillus crispatus]MDK6376305.1 helix-turn-helix transcriptional regulator [Lactobacillus crispatus]MDK8508003.1 helix-turn-helix transcriptional regulator [Lactobacillus crispatus]
MTIGQQLKKFRLLLGLSQADMAAGIVTASFYSKVERDQSEIIIDKLVEILNAHNISLNEFFEAFDKENLPNLNLEKKVYSYFDNRDLGKLIALKKEVKDRDALIYLKLKLIIADLEGRVHEMPQNSQEELRKICLEEDTNAQKNFWDIAISTPLYNFAELKGLITYIFNNQNQYDLTNDQLLISLMNLLIRYLDRCYKENHFAEAEKVGKFVNTMPSNFSIIFHKLVVKYYLALFNNDSELANKIIGLINQSGFQHYTKTLPQIKGEKI